jgi:hypothetical protein
MDAVINTGDALFFTDEEKSQANFKLMELRIKAAEATHGSRLARRLLALMIVGAFLFWFSVACLLVVVAAFVCTADGDYCAPLTASAGISEMLTSAAVGGSVVAIVSWYFWSGVKRVD